MTAPAFSFENLLLAREARSGVKLSQPGPTGRILLYGGELTSLPAACQQMRVVEGTAYVTHGQTDTILRSGEAWSAKPHTGGRARKGKVLISALRNKPLIMELFE